MAPLVAAGSSWTGFPPVLASQTRTIESMQAEANHLPSGLYATLAITVLWPLRGLKGTSWPLVTSQTRTVRSELPETSRNPSGLNATARTREVWPTSV